MLTSLAGFLYAHRRRVLYAAVVYERIGLREGGPPVVAAGG